MSRQSKQAKRQVLAEQFTALHKQGKRGPAKTQKTNKKVNTWFALKRLGRKPKAVEPRDEE